MSKVAIVGVEGSGKTVLMGALCECYKQSAENELYLMPENQSAFMFMERIPHKLRVEHEWPEATSVSALKAMRWTLRLGPEVLNEIEILDYPGELYRLAFGERTKEDIEVYRAELNEFLEHLTSADTLIVLLNPSDLENLGANSRNAETVWITRGIFEYAKKLPNMKRVSLVFTQSDQYVESLNAVGGAQGFYAKQLPMLQTLFPEMKVSAISVMNKDMDGNPKMRDSQEGCIEIMQLILAEKESEKAIHCDALLEKIKTFNDGDDSSYIALLEDYNKSIQKSEEELAPLPKLYTPRIARHRTLWNEAYAPLLECIRNCAENLTFSLKGNPETWRNLRDRFDGCDRLINVFVDSNLKADALQKQQKREIINLICVTLFLLFIVFVILIYSLFLEKQRSAQAYELVKTAFEKELGDSNSSRTALIKKYGETNWNVIKRLQMLGEVNINNPVVGAKAYRDALAILPIAIKEAELLEDHATKLALALSKIRQAKDRGEWQTCLNLADEALILDKGNAEAMVLKHEAEDKLIPTLTVEVEADGQSISASISDGRWLTYETPHTFQLKPTNLYKFTVTHVKTDEVQYKPVLLEITADWQGSRTQRVTLQRMAKEELRKPTEGEIWSIPNLGMILMPVAPGNFLMGSEYGARDESPRRTIRMTHYFWMAKYEVTQREYEQLIGNNPSEFKDDDRPVECVSWIDAMKFCRELTQRELVAGRLPVGYTYRLPTEAEWEYAARGGNKSMEYRYAGANYLDTVAWYDGNSAYSKTHPVGQKQANELGLNDMNGNVWEWCLDWYQDKYNWLDITNPKGPESGLHRIHRGGSFISPHSRCRVTGNRNHDVPSGSYNCLGFRVCLAPLVQ